MGRSWEIWGDIAISITRASLTSLLWQSASIREPCRVRVRVRVRVGVGVRDRVRAGVRVRVRVRIRVRGVGVGK